MKHFSLGILLFICSSGLYACHSDSEPPVEETKNTGAENDHRQELFYRIREAKGTEKPVLLVLLHGFGSNEDDLYALERFFPENYIIVTPQAPVTIGKGRYQWYALERTDKNKTEGNQNDLTASMELMQQLVEQLQETYEVSAERTFITGFSQGAIMSYHLGLIHPELMKGIGAWSGTIYDSLKERMKKKKAGNLQLFIAHGDQDIVIPYTEAEQSASWLEKKGYKPEFHGYKGMAHSVSAEELNDFLTFIEKNL